VSLQPQAWHWAVAGLILLILEVLAPGVSFLWIGVAALAVAALAWLLPGLALWLQVLLFAVLTAVAIVASRRLRSAPVDTGSSRLNQRGQLYLNRVFTLDAPIVNGVGQMRVDDGQWRIAGPDLPATSRVRVVSVEGTTLKVEKAD
jgi:membrane protein implicated in regulation of membrane protease activity